MAVSQLIDSEISTANPVPEMDVKHFENAWLIAILRKDLLLLLKEEQEYMICMYIQMIMKMSYIHQATRYVLKGSFVAVDLVLCPKGATFALAMFVLNQQLESVFVAASWKK